MASSQQQASELLQQLDQLQGSIPTAPKETAVVLSELLQRARQEEAVNETARAIYFLALCALQQEDYEKAISILDETSYFSNQENNNLVRVQVWAYRGSFFQQVGLYEEALQSLLESLELSRKCGYKTSEFMALHNIAFLHSEIGDYKEALKLQRSALDLAKELDIARCICIAYTSEIGNLFLLKEYQEVLDIAHNVLDYVKKHAPVHWICTIMHDQSLAYLKLGQEKTALKVALKAFDIAQKGQDIQAIGEMRKALAEIFLCIGKPKKALKHILDGLKIAENILNRPLLSQNHSKAAQIYEALGNFEQALYHTREYYILEEKLKSKNFDLRSHYLTSAMRYDLLQREAEIERLKNVELVNANKTLQLTQLALLHQATHDALTGAVNRTTLHSRIVDALEVFKDNQNPQRHVGLIFIDVDHFKSINDLYGHHVGDEVLKEVSFRLEKLLADKNDVVARVGGDEFVILLTNMPSAQSAHDRAQEMLDSLRCPFHIDNQQLDVTASVGCAVAPEDGKDAKDLQQNADLAMYSVKHTDRNRAVRFSPEMGVEFLKRQRLEKELYTAADRDELHLYYQGRFHVDNLSLVGFEALIRWQHPEHGLILPNHFIPLAEETGLVIAIGDWVIDEACRQAKAWNFAERGLTMSINVSPLQFEHDDFLSKLQNSIFRHDLQGSVLIIEITESLILRDMRKAEFYIKELQKMGVQIALDDFGKGYSSLSVIHSLPINHLKIDRSFMQDIESKSSSSQKSTEIYKSKVILETMIKLAQHLNMRVTAEGVENSHQLEVLQSLHCDYIQGFYCSHPIPPEKATLMLSKYSKTHHWENRPNPH